MNIYQNATGEWVFAPTPYAIDEQIYTTHKEALMAQRDDTYVAEVKAANQKIWDGINELLALQRQWNALDYGNTLQVSGLTPAEVGAVVFDSANALSAVLATGVATNMAKLL